MNGLRHTNDLDERHKSAPRKSDDLEDDAINQTNGTQTIPPASAHASDPDYVDRITIPLNDVPAFTPSRKLRVAIIGAGYSGMMMAHKLQHQHAVEMSQLLDFVIYEARSTVGGTWDANTCKLSAILFANKAYSLICHAKIRVYDVTYLLQYTASRSSQTQNGPRSLAPAERSKSISSQPSRSGSSTHMSSSIIVSKMHVGKKHNHNGDCPFSMMAIRLKIT